MHAVFLDYATVSRGDLDTTRLDAALGSVEYCDATPSADVPARLAGAAVALANKIRFDADVLAGAPDLRLICLSATGSDNVDLDAARVSGIAVCNIVDYCTASVVQHVYALMLSLTQRLDDYRSALRAGAWTDAGQFCVLEFPVRELAGCTLGIVGHGALGRAVAAAAGAFGMQVLVAARRGQAPGPGRTRFEEVLSRADVVSLHCPLNDDTRNLFDAPVFATMKPDALLINTARGALIDPHALLEALHSGRLAGAGIDVLAEEPPPVDDPLVCASLPNLIVTPHIAWAAREARQRALDEMAANIAAFRRGEHRNRLV